MALTMREKQNVAKELAHRRARDCWCRYSRFCL